MALSNSLPKEDIRALLATELHSRMQNRERRWTALDGPQKKFVDSEHPLILFGGARGGSKSVGMLLAFRRHADKYGKDTCCALETEWESYVDRCNMTHIAGHLYLVSAY